MGCAIRLVMQKYYLQRVLKNFYGNNIPTCFLWYSSHKVGGGSMALTVGSGLQNQTGLQLRYITHFVKMAMIIIVISSRIPLRCPFVK